jgi:hypothetical protein
MHRFSRKMVLAVVVIGALAAGGAAFTANLDLGTGTTAGYGTVGITGATATNVHYTLSNDGTTIASAVITFTGDVSLDTVAVGFDGADLTPCASKVFGTTDTVVTCTAAEFGSVDTHDSGTFAAAVTNP